MFPSSIENILTYLLISSIGAITFIMTLTIHEFAHAYVADLLGDPTARLKGRKTLNPFPHIDPIGTILFPLILQLPFGWAKPVPIDPFNLRNPRRDAALISIAGPLSNLLLAIVLAIGLRLIILFKLSYFFTISSFILLPIIQFNVIIAIFNLLPISPLDGFKIIGGLLDDEKADQWYELERYGIIFLFMLIFPFSGGSIISLIIKPITSFIIQLLIPVSGGII